MHRWKGKEASDNDDGDDDGDDDSADQPTPLTHDAYVRRSGGRGGGRQDKVKKQRKKHSEEPRPPLRDRAELQCQPNRATGC